MLSQLLKFSEKFTKMADRTLYINLKPGVTEEMVRDFFKKYSIQRLAVVGDKAYIELCDVNDIESISFGLTQNNQIEQLHNSFCDQVDQDFVWEKEVLSQVVETKTQIKEVDDFQEIKAEKSPEKIQKIEEQQPKLERATSMETNFILQKKQNQASNKSQSHEIDEETIEGGIHPIEEQSTAFELDFKSQTELAQNEAEIKKKSEQNQKRRIQQHEQAQKIRIQKELNEKKQHQEEQLQRKLQIQKQQRENAEKQKKIQQELKKQQIEEEERRKKQEQEKKKQEEERIRQIKAEEERQKQQKQEQEKNQKIQEQKRRQKQEQQKKLQAQAKQKAKLQKMQQQAEQLKRKQEERQQLQKKKQEEEKRKLQEQLRLQNQEKQRSIAQQEKFTLPDAQNAKDSHQNAEPQLINQSPSVNEHKTCLSSMGREPLILTVLLALWVAYMVLF